MIRSPERAMTPGASSATWSLADGTPVRVEQVGVGSPVVLVHGIPTSPALWRHVVPRIHGARCILLEMVGYGASIAAGRGRDLSLDRQADVLLGLLDALEIERATLVGHDLGGGVAQIAATRAPERCAGLVLTNAVAYDSWPIPSVRALRRLGPALERLPAAALWPVLAALMLRGHDRLDAARRSLALHHRPYAASGEGAAGLVRQTRFLDASDTMAIADLLPGLDVPARIVWGASDAFQPIGYGERLSEALGAPLRPIRGARHFTPEDHPHEIATAVTEVVAQV